MIKWKFDRGILYGKVKQIKKKICRSIITLPPYTNLYLHVQCREPKKDLYKFNYKRRRKDFVSLSPYLFTPQTYYTAHCKVDRLCRKVSCRTAIDKLMEIKKNFRAGSCPQLQRQTDYRSSGQLLSRAVLSK